LTQIDSKRVMVIMAHPDDPEFFTWRDLYLPLRARRVAESKQAFVRQQLSPDQLLTLAHERGIGLRPAWTPLHRLPMYERCPRAGLERTDDLAARIVNLPSSPALAAI